MLAVGGDVGGLSPRVRGKLDEGLGRVFRIGSIPACAGEANTIVNRLIHIKVYPRVCGGSGFCGRHQPKVKGLSPRVRGKRDAPFPVD